ncbi:MAG: hypothetical protein GWN21_02035 [Gammaproteobacteria bacterium]|nr:hypothetical protein [Gammaproteobacteria bacterium]NIW54094.1 hypothetical protein [Gammaproteobacteria bacterium]NIX03238.1 hypothetical protein [Gammaproteobacteria bacterium]
MEAMKFLLICALVLSIVCLVLAVFHWTHLRRDIAKQATDIATQRPLWLEFPRAYTHQGKRHQRRFFAYFVVFVLLAIILLLSPIV